MNTYKNVLLASFQVYVGISYCSTSMDDCQPIVGLLDDVIITLVPCGGRRKKRDIPSSRSTIVIMTRSVKII